MKSKYFYVLSGLIGALVGILIIIAITFKTYAFVTVKNITRTTVQCYCDPENRAK